MDFNLRCKSKNGVELAVRGLAILIPISPTIWTDPLLISKPNIRTDGTTGQCFSGPMDIWTFPMEQFLKDGIGEHLDFEMLH